jgi:hypothetical protein
MESGSLAGKFLPKGSSTGNIISPDTGKMVIPVIKSKTLSGFGDWFASYLSSRKASSNLTDPLGVGSSCTGSCPSISYFILKSNPSCFISLPPSE